MANALILRLTNRIPWRLLSKVAFAAAALWYAVHSDFSLWSGIVFFVVAAGVYYSLLPDRTALYVSFSLAACLGFFGLFLLRDASPAISFLAVIGFGALFFLVVGLVQFFFKDRMLVFGILETVLFLAIFAILFSLTEFVPLAYEVPWFFGTALLVFLLFRESFLFTGIAVGRRMNVLSLTAALLATELVWFLRFLPLGFLNNAAFLTLFLILLKDGIKAHTGGTLSHSFVFRSLVIFVFFSVIILAASRWVI